MQDTVPERLASLETSWEMFQERYERDTLAAIEARTELNKSMKTIQETLVALNNKEQQLKGMLKAARIGWALCGVLAAISAYIGFGRIGQFFANFGR